MDYMLEPPEPPEDRDPPRSFDDGPLEPDEWSDEDADRAEDRWIAERDSFYK